MSDKIGKTCGVSIKRSIQLERNVYEQFSKALENTYPLDTEPIAEQVKRRFKEVYKVDLRESTRPIKLPTGGNGEWFDIFKKKEEPKKTKKYSEPFRAFN